MADIVRVKNRAGVPFEGRYNNQPFTIPARGDSIIDREAAIIWFGDWEARDIGRDPRMHFRSQEVARLKGLYGAHFDDPREDPRFENPLTADEKWERNKPQIDLFEADGTPIISVIADPTGKGLPIEGAPAEDLAAVMADMQRQMTELQSKLIAAQEAASTSDIPEDSPNDAPRRRRGPVTVEQARDTG